MVHFCSSEQTKKQNSVTGTDSVQLSAIKELRNLL